METRFLLPGRRRCLCQGKGAGRAVCGEETERLVRRGSGESQDASWP